MRIILLPLLAAASLASGLAACSDKPTAQVGQAAATAATATAASTLTLDALNLPRFKAGLWETVQTDPDGEVETARQCVGPEVSGELREMLTRETPQCRTERHASPQGIHIEALCDQAGGLKTQTRFELSGSDTHYDMQLGLYVVKPDGTRDGGDTQVKARWLGACPAGMEPGEAVEG